MIINQGMPFNVTFSTSSINEEILNLEPIKNAIKEKLSIDTDDEYNSLLAKGLFPISFDIFTSGTRFSVNGLDYAYGSLTSDAVYSTNGYMRTKVKSIRSEAVITDAVFSFDILLQW